MSTEAIESVLGKILLEVEFRLALLADPDQALAGFDLTESEKAELKSMDAETMDVLANTLDSRAGIWLNHLRKTWQTCRG